MISPHKEWLNILFVVIGILFFTLEFLLPERKINRTTEIGKDLSSIFLLVLTGPLISVPLISFYQTHPLPAFLLLWQLPSWSKILLATLLTDFCNYCIHYYMHKSHFYWKAHVSHHRIVELYWFSGLRASLGHYISFILSRATIGMVLFQLTSAELLIYLTIGLLGSCYQHTNSRISHPWPEWIFMSPRAHRLHHAENGRRMKNLGTIFSFWDRLFNSYLDPNKAELDYTLGIPSNDQTKHWKEYIGI
jgi:sterol desaturase/sphingolipid hydroxylase (fatty acid hydroxylase superfamily)